MSLREYVLSLMREQMRAIEIAEREREKAASALRTELERAIAEGDRNLRDHIQAQVEAVREALNSAEKLELERVGTINRLIESSAIDSREAMRVAEQEREKAAVALRTELARAIEEGDRNLRDHIRLQREQVDSGLRTVEQRFIDAEAHAETAVGHLRAERELITRAQDQAIAKAETANEKRFEAVNEFRAQLSDQTAGFLPRETFDSVMSQMNDWRASTDRRLDRQAGAKAGTASQMAAIIGVSTFVIALVVAVANLLGS